MTSQDDSHAEVHPHVSDTGGTVLVCQNGHLTGEPAPGGPSLHLLRCPQCNAPTMSACPGCQEPIRGVPASAHPASPQEGFLPGTAPLTSPRYCHCCGRPFPWTERVVSAVRTAIRHIGTLDAYERDQLRRSIDHLIHETPQTRLAIVRINAALSRIGGETASTLREMLVSIASEGVRSQLVSPDQGSSA